MSRAILVFVIWEYILFINKILFFILNLYITIYILWEVHTSRWTISIIYNKKLCVQILVSPHYISLDIHSGLTFFRIYFGCISLGVLFSSHSFGRFVLFRKVRTFFISCLGSRVCWIIYKWRNSLSDIRELVHGYDLFSFKIGNVLSW